MLCFALTVTCGALAYWPDSAFFGFAGIAASQLGDWKRALAALSSAADHAESCLQANDGGHSTLVNTKSQPPEPERQQSQVLQDAVMMRATAGRALLAQASIFKSQGNRGEAIQAVKKAVQHDPKAVQFLAELQQDV